MARAWRMRRARNAAGPAPEAPTWRPARWALIAGLGLPLLAVIVLLVSVLSQLPDLDAVQETADRRIVFTDADGGPLLVRGGVPSEYAASEAIPDVVRQAVLAVEDQRFREHSGFDLRDILRAGWRNLLAGEVVEGGSTLTQQLVKISYLEPERTFSRKLQEIALALQLERAQTKDQILTRYLNAVYMGSGATGMPAAARIYFDVELSEVSTAQAAALAATIRTPSTVNPRSNPAALRERAALVLDLMGHRNGFLPRKPMRRAQSWPRWRPRRTSGTAMAAGSPTGWWKRRIAWPSVSTGL
ncbi:biosynthetic peptidoglycan transglycosylase [Hoeflea halophila]|uniref:biosynthetic peptidoglycan transglycosylase n=1 Tax=Hoeflea halophila TaxID=714899 RepID=UPI00117AABC1|nr:biosynthetic peptidoglycan transglycosylase [Hoeflea halophila]